jgi:8-oxo-dGTP diphosphatase
MTMEPVVAVAIVTSRMGVLIGRRRDGKTRRGRSRAARSSRVSRREDAAVREALEETGLRVRAIGVIGSRIHPRTGVPNVYVAAVPASEVVGPPNEELAKVRWVSPAEAGGLLAGMFEAVRQHLRRTSAD